MAGGAGVATENGSIYFLSPEKLDTSDPENEPAEDQANLYLAEPGSSPRFVATIDTSEGKPGPPPPLHPVADPGLVSGLGGASSVAVDQSNGDIYAVETETEDLARFTSAGAADNFSVPGGSNKITIEPGAAGRSEVAVDNAPGSPFQGDFYVKSGFASIAVFAPTGEQLRIRRRRRIRRLRGGSRSVERRRLPVRVGSKESCGNSNRSPVRNRSAQRAMSKPAS